MYSKLHRPKKNELGVSINAGSCVKLADYLSKESTPDKPFFSHHADSVSLIEVIDKIDNNKRTLKKYQDKYYMLSYNPSQREISHLIYMSTGKRVNELSELTADERSVVFNEFREYVRECMNIYASKFSRDKVLTADDLVYFGKLEEYRHYSHEDEEVKLGHKQRGDLKEGLNLHAHIIVSRMDASQTISLSPLSASRGNTNLLNGKEVKNGFNMQEWQVDCYQHFMEKYGYVASAEERFYNNHAAFSKSKHKLQNKIMNEVLEGMNEERKALVAAKNITLLLHPSKKALNLYLKQKIKNILFESESVI